MSLHILKSGILDTIQDRGRFGYAHLGINQNGAMDRLALTVANALLGNDPAEAALEMHFPAPEICLEQDVLLSLAGADFTAHANGVNIPANSAAMLKAGSVLKFKQINCGARCYLAVQGGFYLEPWLGSFSTNLAAGTGAWKGRALHTGDRLPFRKKAAFSSQVEEKKTMLLSFRANVAGLLSISPSIRFCPGPEYDCLDEASKQEFEQNAWQIGRNSDRMGYRLMGPQLRQKDSAEKLSSAVLPGTIQLLPNGQLIVLMADSQTTGGYPRIGQVIQTDMPKLAQMNAGQKISWQEVPLEVAFDAIQSQEQSLRRLQIGCKLQMADHKLYFTT